MKHEWRKAEKDIYLPKNKPQFIDIPEYQFITIAGKGNPNDSPFADRIGALYAVAYAIKMTLKKEAVADRHNDYTVYPLEGVWDISEKAKKEFNGAIDKNELVYQLMIRQPDFVTPDFVQKMIALSRQKKPNALIDQVKFERISEGPCIQMLHLGSYDEEDKSFREMEDFAESSNLERVSKIHREIYLSDFRKVAPDKLKTVLRFKVRSSKSGHQSDQST
ncbi:MAG: GyrI-like domain-containing protein [Reichenbachiella sp.]|uniref:GyrI-like domain-containing protein n=1 Tax=Reichenbachiella sp. TaxID=2184521 RepID=UPI0032630DD5